MSTNSYTPTSAFAYNTTYYVTIITVGAAGESVGCSETSFTTIPDVPSNDDCLNAITLTPNPDLSCNTIYHSYTLGATDSGVPTGSCFGTLDDDVWFKFVATNQAHKISLLNVQAIGSNVYDDDIYFQVFSGEDCETLSLVTCSDDNSKLLSGLIIGDTYYIRVYSYYSAGSHQSFDICIGTLPPTPANDDCSNAIQVTNFPYTYTQTDASGATNNSGMLTTCSNEMNDGTWFNFVGDGDSYNITVTLPSGSTFDHQIGIFSGTCEALVCEDTVDAAGAGETETLSIATIEGTTYYINVGHYSGWTDQLEEEFTIEITKDGALGNADINSIKAIRMYPNPFDNILNISNINQVKSISILDMTGSLVKTFEKPQTQMPLNNLKSGLYIIRLNMLDGSQQNLKVIKK